jgi:protein-tyrosine phosphatase
MAEGVFRKMIEDAGYAEHVEVDSAGTHAYHTNEPPDARAQEAAARRGVEISGLRGRQATAEDFVRFDYVLAMDRENHANLRALCPPGQERRLRLFLEFAVTSIEREVPDPYFGGASGFNRVLDLIEDAAQGLLADVQARIDSTR